jgi:hypothetical protein
MMGWDNGSLMEYGIMDRDNLWILYGIIIPWIICHEYS